MTQRRRAFLLSFLFLFFRTFIFGRNVDKVVLLVSFRAVRRAEFIDTMRDAVVQTPTIAGSSTLRLKKVEALKHYTTLEPLKKEFSVDEYCMFFFSFLRVLLEGCFGFVALSFLLGNGAGLSDTCSGYSSLNDTL